MVAADRFLVDRYEETSATMVSLHEKIRWLWYRKIVDAFPIWSRLPSR